MSYLGDACDAARGLQCPKETCKRWTGGKLLWGMVFQTTRTHVMKVSAPCPVVKQKQDAGNTVFSSYLEIRTNDDRDFTPKMTLLRTFQIFWEIGMCSKMPNPRRRTKPPTFETKKGAFEEAWTMKVTGGQLVTMSLVPGTVDSNVTSECHLFFWVMPPHS